MNYYEILNIEQNASQEEIKKSYRKLAMLHHPDRNQGKKISEDKFKKINEAYDTLSDPMKRKTYDDSLFSTNRAHMPQHDFDDLVNSVFKGSGFDSVFKQTFKQPQTKRVNVHLGFWEAVFGLNKSYEIAIQHNNKSNNFRFDVTFPPGTNTHDIFTFTANEHTVQFIVIVDEDITFKRDNLDLYTNIDIPMTTALLGGKINFIHWEKTLEINIPANIKNKQIIRLSNFGIKKNMFIGDLYLTCNIVLPHKINARQKELLEEFAQLEEDNHKKTFGEHLKEVWSKLLKKS